MKKRINTELRVAYGFGGHLQDDLEKYQGFMEVALERGWRVVVLYERFEIQLRRLLEAGAVDAVVGDFISESWIRGLPGSAALVHVGDAPLSERVFSVSPDGRAIGRAAARHFEETGLARRLLYAPRRMAEVRRGMEEEGGAPVEWMRTPAMLEERLAEPGEAGVFCVSDYLARQAIQSATRAGREVPGEIGVLGMGDRFWDGVVAGMEISSLRMPYREFGRAAATLLVENLADGAPRHLRIPPGRVVVRDSSRRGGVSRLQRLADDLLADHLADAPEMAELARRAGMSRRAFETAFSRETGTTPYDYLLRLREVEAKRLLKETDLTVTDIGARVGYPDPPRFSAFFKRRVGAPPGIWRRGAVASGQVADPSPARSDTARSTRRSGMSHISATAR